MLWPIELFPRYQGRWWRGEDSNLRRLRRQIYSLLPLAAREPLLPEKPYSPRDAWGWSWRWESNPQPADYKSAALPLSYASRKGPFIKAAPIQILTL